MAIFLYVGADSNQWFDWSAFDTALNLALWVFAGELVYALSLILTGL